ncbi:hypothetical protein pb186bvf_001115 [Paramecium bursaria]
MTEYLNFEFEDYFDSYQQQFTTTKNTDNSSSSDDIGVKKKIAKKQYEPIYDNQILYRYEDNPEQYKRIRKKQQNRESANRVRGRQKNYVQDIEQEMIDLKKENQDMQMINAKLQAENNQLKEQVQFLRELLLKDPKSINPPFLEKTNQYGDRQILSMTTFTAVVCIILVAFAPSTGAESTSIAAETKDKYVPEQKSYTMIIGSLLVIAWIAFYVIRLINQKKKIKLY